MSRPQTAATARQPGPASAQPARPGEDSRVPRWIKPAVARAAQAPLLRELLIALSQAAYAPIKEWRRTHPFDREHGVRTSGFVPGLLIDPDAQTCYAPAQPSVIRRALAAIPERSECAFVDVGCGKGRALFVASEFEFRRIIGVELSPPLARDARRNLARFAQRRPVAAARIEIVLGDALAYAWPDGPLVVFLYNTFTRPLVARLCSTLAASLREHPRDLYVVYDNPTWAEVFDAAGELERRYAAQLPYEPSELAYGPDGLDAVVIWQNRGNPHPKPPGRAEAPVVAVVPGVRARLVDPIGQTQDAASQ